MKKPMLLLACLLAFGTGALAQAPYSRGNITAAGANCQVTNACVVLPMARDVSYVSVLVTGTFSATLKPEKTVDGTTWTSAGADITAAGTTVYFAASMKSFRVRGNAYTSGTAAVYISASTSVSGNITSGTGAPSGTCAATDLFVDDANGNVYSCVATVWTLAGGGSGANTTLSNLGVTAINAHLIPATDNATDLGDATHAFRNAYYYNLIGSGSTTAIEGPVSVCTTSAASKGRLHFTATGPQWSYNTGACVPIVQQVCEIAVGDPGAASSALADDNDTPVACVNKKGVTLTIASVECYAASGSPTVTPIVTGGAATSILTGALTCGTGSFATGTLNGTPTLANGGTIDFNITTAGGVAKYLLMRVVLTL